ncbi:MAG: hypothetical protein NTX28_08135 [Novosphingobium sp.]|nr:hypothetical protein [Novosphingobium sp.]
MRVLEKNEVSEVSGGTFCLIGGLLSGFFSRLTTKTTCAPAPTTCAPAPKPRTCW